MDRTSSRHCVLLQGGRRSAAGAWARRIARTLECETVRVDVSMPGTVLLDTAHKAEASAIVVAPIGIERGVIDPDLARLWQRAPCPVWTVAPWIDANAPLSGVAVAGVDATAPSRAAACEAAAFLDAYASPGRLLLVHGSREHPAERAATTPWPRIQGSVERARELWLDDLASRLRAPERIVSLSVRPTWAPDLIEGEARCANADFVAVGARRRSEGAAESGGRLLRRIARATARPILSVNG